jgi:hypothetical protein
MGTFLISAILAAVYGMRPEWHVFPLVMSIGHREKEKQRKNMKREKEKLRKCQTETGWVT